MEQKYCPFCMKPLDNEAFCSFCGKEPQKYKSLPHHIEAGSYLMGRYCVGASLGEGGFGITYLGLDVELDRKVAIKEFFPRSIVWREVTQSTAVNCYTKNEETYQKGCEQFLAEARVLACIENSPEIVQVYDFFKENNTAYIVMEYLEGQTLKDRIKTKGVFSPAQLFGLLEPVVKCLSVIHNSGLIHRDISPDNLMLLNNGRVKLMDFGCARETNIEHTMTVMLKPGFAPPEQYYGQKQGPWTDVYAFCATIYYCLTGKLPPASIMRVANDELEAPSKLGVKISAGQEQALLKGLSPNTETRYKSMDELYEGLYNAKAFVLPSLLKKTEAEKDPAHTKKEKNIAQTISFVTKNIKESIPTTKKPKNEKNENADGGKAGGQGKKKKAGLFAAVGVIALLCFLVLFSVLHNHSDFCNSTVEKEPTCSEEGVMAYRCICLKKWTEPIPKTEHTVVVQKGVSATCTADGITDGYYCSVCNTVITAQNVIPAKGHGETDKNGYCTVCKQPTYSELLEFTLNSDGSSYTVSQKGYASGFDAVIPEMYEGLPVTTIGRFEHCRSIIIPPSITTISEKAFQNNNEITSIVIPENVTDIGDYAFASSGLVKAELNCSEKRLGKGAFMMCRRLSEVTLPSGMTHIGDSAFEHCGSLTAITFPKDLIYVGHYAFHQSALKEANLPYGLVTIGEYAFFTNSLELAVVPITVENVFSNAFGGYSLSFLHCVVSSKPKYWKNDWVADNIQVLWGEGVGG